MKLIRLETKGFKSFADKTVLYFDGGVVGVVGPNGSGKSNINDAIKWVLGEQSIKSLRGDSSDDVIFSGSKTLKQAEKAYVSLTFDNENQKIALPHKKITITREINRGQGGSTYFLNDEIARLKDIKAIAMESGIGKSSLAIISQGTISDIAEASAEERRFIFEEAAGISKYKQRKKEALRKLDSTTQVLEKVATVTKELEKQVKPLEAQAEKAKIYLDKKKALKDVEIALIAKDINFFSKKLETLNIELEDVINTKEHIDKKLITISASLEEKTTYKYKLENEIQKISQDYQIVSDQLRDLDVQQNNAAYQRKLILEGQVNSNNATKLQAMNEELKSLGSKLARYKNWQEKSNQDIDLKVEEINNLKYKRAQLETKIEQEKNRLMQIKTKLAILKDYRDNRTNLFKGTKTILDNKNLFPNFIGLVADLLEVPSEYKIAIETLLANALQNIVVEDSATAVKAINFLSQNKGGRATFIPLQNLKPKGVVEEHYQVAQMQEGFLGTGAELVKTKVKFEILKKFLLGNVLIVDTIDHASQIAKILNHRYMIVTLNGDIVRVGGVMSGGQKNQNHALLANEEQIEKLEISIPEYEKLIQQEINEINQLSNQIGEANSIIAELKFEMAKVSEKITITNSQYNSLKVTYETYSKKKFNEKELEINNNSLSDLEAQKSSLDTLLKAKRESVILQNNDLSSLTMQKNEFEKTLRDIMESSTEKMTNKNQAEFIIKQSKQRLLEEYEMTLESASKFELTIAEEKARQLVERLRREIRELGTVNIDAIEEFEAVNKRYQKHLATEEEVFSAQQTIIGAISEMDAIIVTKLDETVKNVNQEFNNVFNTMFGGGFAEIKYTLPNNLLETGIDVIAQPPGKTVKNLKLFSGGEKAMIAISLLFAVLKSKPLPLCILDEVEAPLDDANVVRFANYLQELKKQTQFIVITHRIGTMSRVDNIFGATMQKRGSTSFFTVKLDDAKKLVA